MKPLQLHYLLHRIVRINSVNENKMQRKMITASEYSIYNIVIIYLTFLFKIIIFYLICDPNRDHSVGNYTVELQTLLLSTCLS